MKHKKDDNVVIVFEPACDAHWMKDVVQFPNALAQELYGKNAILIARPNPRQTEISKHIELVLHDDPIHDNDALFESYDFSKIITKPEWYTEACEIAAQFGSILILYPWYGDFALGGKIFKVERWKKFRAAKVIVKSDGLFRTWCLSKSSHGLRLKERLRYFYINNFVIENRQIEKEMRLNNPHFSRKLLYLPNCPLDIFHAAENNSYSNRSDKFLFVGRIDDPEKGADILLQSWTRIAQRIPGWKLEMAGPCSSQARHNWIKVLKELDIEETVLWSGSHSPLELVSLYKSAKVLVCPSRKESGPIVLTESILCGCAVIGASVGEIPEVLKGLPGLIDNAKTLEMEMLHFAQHPQIATMQALSLYERVKDRKWRDQAKKWRWH